MTNAQNAQPIRTLLRRRNQIKTSKSGGYFNSESETDHARVVDDLDVLIIQEDGELDEAEDKLCNSSAQLETGNSTENEK